MHSEMVLQHLCISVDKRTPIICIACEASTDALRLSFDLVRRSGACGAGRRDCTRADGACGSVRSRVPVRKLVPSRGVLCQHSSAYTRFHLAVTRHCPYNTDRPFDLEMRGSEAHNSSHSTQKLPQHTRALKKLKGRPIRFPFGCEPPCTNHL